MGLRTLAFTFGVAAVLSAQHVAALGLGQIRLNSALNQPLDAEIELLQVDDLSKREILVGLASSKAFERVGVARPFFLSSLEFEVDFDSSGNAVIHVTSDKPVHEPYLNFIVEAQWPSGRLLREYTLLMDLPVYAADKPSQPVQPAATPQPSTTATNRPAPEQRQARDSSVEPAEQSLSGTIYGPVKASDTLWEIAASTRPVRSISVQQAMIAIQRANPGAFINNNINLLRKGQVLRIPSREEMIELSTREALAEVAYQNQRWSGSEAVAERPQLEGSRSYTPEASPSGEPAGRLNLTSAEDYSDSAEGRGTGAGNGSTEALENKLTTTQEELDKVRGENTELKSRLEALEAEIATMERLLAVSNEEMRALQLAAQEAQEPDKAAPETAVKMPGENDPINPSDAPMPEPAQAEPQVQQGQQPEVAEEVAPERDPTNVVVIPEPKKTVLDLLLDNILFIALGLVALLAAVVLFLRNRKKENEEEYDDFLTESEAEEWEETEPYENEFTDEGEEDFDLDAEIEDTTGVETEHTEQETEDAVAEAEIYIALAKYDQAEEILLRALEKTPQDMEIRLKLLELYAIQQDVENFDPHYARLRVLGDEGANARAEEQRNRIEGAPEFDETRFDTSDFASMAGVAAAAGVGLAASQQKDEDVLSSDFDTLGEEPAEDAVRLDEEINTSLNEAESLDEFDLNLDLDGDLDQVADEPDQEGADQEKPNQDPVEIETLNAEALDTENTLELDLDLDGITQADKPDLNDELTYDLNLDEAEEDTAEDITLLRPEENPAETAADVEDSGIDFELSDELQAGTEPVELEEEPETLENSIEEDLEASLPTAETLDESEEDNLNMDAEMDLSALDEELDAMTSGLDAGEESTMAEEPLVDSKERLLEEELTPTEEPITKKSSSTEEEISSEETPAPADETKEPASDYDDTLLETASAEFDLEDIDPEAEDDSDLGFLSDSDETATKLDLARAYIDMGDADGAKDILDEIMQEGNDNQRNEAQQLMERV